MRIQVSEIFSSFSSSGLLTEHLGSDAEITGINSVEFCGNGDLIFVDDKKYVEKARDKGPAAIVTNEELKNEFHGSAVLVAPNVKLAHAMLKQEYADRDFALEQWDQIHPTAVIHDTAKIGNDCHIGPHVVIGKNTKIGDRAVLLAGVVIEHDCCIGNDCILFANSVIGYGSVLGNGVEIGMGSVIGAEGFGFAQDEKRRSHRLPQTGNVVIEDNVRIGGNNVIDRAPYGRTRIGEGTKTDNLCHFAHGVDIGKDCLLTAMFCIAGSSEIGDRVITSGQTGVLDHKKVVADSVFVHRAGVLKDIDEPGLYAGLPTQPFAEYTKNIAQFRKLNEMAKKIKALEKKLADMES